MADETGGDGGTGGTGAPQLHWYTLEGWLSDKFEESPSGDDSTQPLLPDSQAKSRKKLKEKLPKNPKSLAWWKMTLAFVLIIGKIVSSAGTSAFGVQKTAGKVTGTDLNKQPGGIATVIVLLMVVAAVANGFTAWFTRVPSMLEGFGYDFFKLYRNSKKEKRSLRQKLLAPFKMLAFIVCGVIALPFYLLLKFVGEPIYFPINLKSNLTASNKAAIKAAFKEKGFGFFIYTVFGLVAGVGAGVGAFLGGATLLSVLAYGSAAPTIITAAFLLANWWMLPILAVVSVAGAIAFWKFQAESVINHATELWNFVKYRRTQRVMANASVLPPTITGQKGSVHFARAIFTILGIIVTVAIASYSLYQYLNSVPALLALIGLSSSLFTPVVAVLVAAAIVTLVFSQTAKFVKWGTGFFGRNQHLLVENDEAIKPPDRKQANGQKTTAFYTRATILGSIDTVLYSSGVLTAGLIVPFALFPAVFAISTLALLITLATVFFLSSAVLSLAFTVSKLRENVRQLTQIDAEVVAEKEEGERAGVNTQGIGDGFDPSSDGGYRPPSSTSSSTGRGVLRSDSPVLQPGGERRPEEQHSPPRPGQHLSDSGDEST